MYKCHTFSFLSFPLALLVLADLIVFLMCKFNKYCLQKLCRIYLSKIILSKNANLPFLKNVCYFGCGDNATIIVNINTCNFKHPVLYFIEKYRILHTTENDIW